MRVLFVASEAYPLIKTGGLADVVGALPLAFAKYAVETQILMPLYKSLIKLKKGKKPKYEFEVFEFKAKIFECEKDGLNFLLLDIPKLYDREGGPYVDENSKDFPDNYKRFAALGLAGAKLAIMENFDILHAHDWQAASAPIYLKYIFGGKIPSILTIHNLAFQGRFGKEVFDELELPQACYSIEGLEYFGDVSFLKGGINCADIITTVSPTYAEEIKTENFGAGLDGLLREKSQSLFGIINGIDNEIWNPSKDENLNAKYDAKSLEKRQINKKHLQKTFGILESDAPLFCVVSRLTEQKGIDVLIELFGAIAAMGAQLIILGAGDKMLEAKAVSGAKNHPDNIAIKIGYDEKLSHQMQGGSDVILVPSRFEPCGLTQLYGLAYGCVPLVSRTGGLNDTIIDANEAAIRAGVATGIGFNQVNLEDFGAALWRAVTLYKNQKLWRKIQTNGMKADFSWEMPAKSYISHYKSLKNKALK